MFTGNRDYTGMWVRLGSTDLMAGKLLGDDVQSTKRCKMSQVLVLFYSKARETKTTKNATNRVAERRTVRSKQTTTERPCSYYLRSRVRQPEGFPEERRNSGLASIPQNNIRRRSLSMQALHGEPVDRCE
ncbi:uncharacterized protein TNCV_874761 [Trichonephila clavipes]|nr:uncharacterized protein TNCV_874761 [Trichonephila clavipes]